MIGLSSLQALATHTTNVAAGAGVINMSHELLYIVMAVGAAYFLGGGIIRAIRDHTKRGTGAALSSIAGGVLLAIVVMHVVGLYQRGNQEFEHLPGSVGHSNGREW